MFKWLFHTLIFASSEYQNKEKPPKRQRKLGLEDKASKVYSSLSLHHPDDCKTRLDGRLDTLKVTRNQTYNNYAIPQ